MRAGALLLCALGCGASARAPDSCALLRAAGPEQLLGGELAEPLRVYGLCRVEVAAATERSAGLELRRDAPAVAHDLASFWEREGGGVGLAGGTREGIREQQGLGDYALWHPVEGGLRVFAYRGEWVLVLTVTGVPRERALPWSLELARRALDAAP